MSKVVYRGGSTIVGPLKHGQSVKYRKILSRKQNITLNILMFISTFATALLVLGLLMPTGLSFYTTSLVAVAAIVLVEAIRLLQIATLFFFASFASDPIPLKHTPGKRIAVLTTIVPGKEPFEIVAKTLLAMKRMSHDPKDRVDVWLLDEGNDKAIKKWCRENGVKHFSRKGVEKWNTTRGEFKAKTKHGNHNAWRDANETNYDIVAQMDPDHTPRRNFLTRTLGYFNDPDTAFVVAPQVYGNIHESWIAKGSAFQAYVFHGIIQRGGNGTGAPLLIGTNHLYRTKAFMQICGYQDSIIEDHLTSMVIYGASNQETGNKWRGVYTPDIVAVGEGPTSFTDYFNQQKRWAYGIWEIATKSSLGAMRKMSRRQAVTFAMLQFFYPSVAISWVIGTFGTILASLSVASRNETGAQLIMLYWIVSVATSLGIFYWMRQFNLVKHEQRDWGLEGMGLLIMCIPIYTSAAVQALTRKPLTYAVTAKGNLASPDNVATFAEHIKWFGLNMAAIVIELAAGLYHSFAGVVWVLAHALICILPIALYGFSNRKKLMSARFKTQRLSFSRS